MSQRFPSARRYKRRWIVKKHAPLKWAAVVALIAVVAILTVVLLHGQAKSVNQPIGAGLANASAALPESPLPAISINPTATATPEPTFSKKPAEGFLILVNWENPIPSEERPSGLVSMGTIFEDELVLANHDGSINQVAGEAAKAMFEAAKAAGVGKYIITSAYRAISYQETLFQQRLAQEPGYADDPFANPVKVMPGKCSEHTTGLAVDILAENYREADDGYADSSEGKWLQENAYRFGFILRYPKDKEHITGVIYEPWHYRYVGVEAATEMVEMGLCLEEYVYAP